MSEGTAPAGKSDGFIAARKAELGLAIASEPGLPQGEGAAMGELFHLLGALMHHEAHAHLEALKALYDPLDPDAPPSRRDVGLGAFETFERELTGALTRANFIEIDPDTVQTRETTQ